MPPGLRGGTDPTKRSQPCSSITPAVLGPRLSMFSSLPPPPFLHTDAPMPDDIEFEATSEQVRAGGPRATNKNGEPDDPSGRIWSLYLSHAEKYDKTLSESWKGDTEGILVFTGLFSATVSAFLVESYKNLQPDSGDATVQLLTQISLQLAAIANGTHPAGSPHLVQQPTFRAPSTALRVNIAWVLSLALSLTCALAATLMQQWTRRYMQAVSRHSVSALGERARIRAFFAEGVERFGMSHAVEAIPALLHLAVFLFFAGLVEFMFSNDVLVGCITLAFVVCCAAAYITLTIIPILFHNSPYQTPLSAILWNIFQRILFLYCWLIRTSAMPALNLAEDLALKNRIHLSDLLTWWAMLPANLYACKNRLANGMRRTREDSAEDVSFRVASRALAWTLESLDKEHEHEAFLSGMADFARSQVPDAPAILVDVMLVRGHLRNSIFKLVPPHPHVRALTPVAMRYRRIAASVEALWVLAHAISTAAVRADFQIYDERGPLHTLASEINGYRLHVYPTAELADTEFADLEARIDLTKACTNALLNRLRIMGLQTKALPPSDAPALADAMHIPLDVLRADLQDGRTAQLANLMGFAACACRRIEQTRHVRPDADPCLALAGQTLWALARDFQNRAHVSGAARTAVAGLYHAVLLLYAGPSVAGAESAEDESAGRALWGDVVRVLRDVVWSTSAEGWHGQPGGLGGAPLPDPPIQPEPAPPNTQFQDAGSSS
ncbi:hypothetical protein BV25DRAFT_232952 [Artomyces pyxidatus]|uniref:Uncharacterized protein n=1 Tax=Artomyces pyxidatus TaxID=48021 RepID=A0ACB8SGC1_9AGAM|nr:hypothetical protein BV25DRAFT_232952 [Artomyces pyxidatus]